MQIRAAQSNIDVYWIRTKHERFKLVLWIPDSVLKPTIFARSLLLHLDPVRQHDHRVALDIGTGCGVLALALKKLGFREVDATDINADALVAAEVNGIMNGCKVGLRIIQKSLLHGLDRKYDLIVSNPPTFPVLGERCPDHAIDQAFFCGSTGKEFIDSVSDNACSFLVPGGKLLLLVPSYLEPERTLKKLRSHGLHSNIRARMEVPVGAYVRKVSLYGLNGNKMIDAVLRGCQTTGVKNAFKLDREGRPAAFWLNLVEARKRT